MDFTTRRLTAILENALLEDRATRDATSYACIDPNQRASATILAKQDCILAGIGCVARILEIYAALDGAVTSHHEVTTHPEIFDGVRLHTGQSVAVIRHNARVILSCERVMLNFLQRMSGIATLTRRFVDAVSGTKARILDTRKTAPGLRVIDKYAVRHRSLRSKSAPRKNSSRPWPVERKPFCWTTCLQRKCAARLSAVPIWIAASRSSVPAASVWKMFVPTPKPVSISFQ
jgi:hypothetical protein